MCKPGLFMNARSEGDETLCGWAHGVEEPEGIAAHYVDLRGPAGVAQKFRVSETSNAPEGRASTCTATASGSSAAVGHS